ncbi:hypothetical protein [Roseobacter litoralis]|uniref:hypothetical protein n=1 Tax=Roseobacter litoralis TaxID=42443 RepID=UPI000160C28C|nr:hypothetical protein [Roseobacter litoralis]
MKKTSQTVSHPDLKGSEQHHPLKNRDGEKGDSDHAKSDEVLTGDTAKKVKETDADTQIADQLRDLATDE